MNCTFILLLTIRCFLNSAKKITWRLLLAINQINDSLVSLCLFSFPIPYFLFQFFQFLLLLCVMDPKSLLVILNEVINIIISRSFDRNLSEIKSRCFSTIELNYRRKVLVLSLLILLIFHLVQIYFDILLINFELRRHVRGFLI